VHSTNLHLLGIICIGLSTLNHLNGKIVQDIEVFRSVGDLIPADLQKREILKDSFLELGLDKI